MYMFKFENDRLNNILKNFVELYEDGIQTDKFQLAGSIFKQIKISCSLCELEAFNILLIKYFLDKEI